MKRLKSIIIMILAVALCASLLTTASAKHNGKSGKKPVLSADIQTLIDLGLLVGSDDRGVTDEYAKSKPTRIQAFIIYLRLIKEAQKLEEYLWHDGDRNFDDHHGHSPYVKKGMAFAKAHPEYNWIGSNGRFNPMAHLTARQYAKVLLAALGYQDGADFTWDTVESVAEGLGLNVPKGAFTFETLASMTVRALSMYVKGTTQKLIDRLGFDPATDTTSLTVTSAPAAVAVDKLQVVFSNPMKTVDPSEFRLYKPDGVTPVSAGSAYTLDATGRVVTITIAGSLTADAKASAADASPVKLAIGTAHTKDIFGNAVSGEVAVAVTAATPATVSVLDKIAPAVIALETQDLDKDGYLDAVRLIFNENVKDRTVSAPHFNVAGYGSEAFRPTTAGDTADNNVIFITFKESGTPDTGITPTITYTQGTLEDLAGNKLASIGALAAVDKAAPAVVTALPVGTLTAGGATPVAALALSEDLTAESRAAILTAVQAHSTVNDLVTTGDIAVTYIWTTNRLLTVSVTANANGGTNPDTITLSAASADLLDAAGNKTTAAQIIR